MTEASREGLRAISRLSFRRFVGPSIVSAAFDVDGRGGDYDLVFGWDPEEQALWTSREGDYAVAYLAGFDPPTVVLRHDGGTVGFYMGGELWIDDAHRGQGLAPEMILALVQRHGGVPFDNGGGLGFTPAGYAAHRRAHALAVERTMRPERDDGRQATSIPRA